ncbi:MAG: hypothetical protein UV64_C0007G0011 [Parcubacteria group bacterium GW2011_GWC1_43_11b]|nr:MAG: hypothetical protein UV64_C0007G0011 [Parcubacteria group bacterium GW2011_GWC1_43_11b]
MVRCPCLSTGRRELFCAHCQDTHTIYCSRCRGIDYIPAPGYDGLRKVVRWALAQKRHNPIDLGDGSGDYINLPEGALTGALIKVAQKEAKTLTIVGHLRLARSWGILYNVLRACLCDNDCDAESLKDLNKYLEKEVECDRNS